MMEPAIITTLKHIGVVVIGPIIGLFGWLGKRLYNRVDAMEKELTRLDKGQAVQQSQVNDIKQDIHNMDKKLDKILDKLQK